MRKYLHLDLNSLTVESEDMEGQALARAGRYLIAKTLLEGGVAEVNPLSADNPLIFSAGPFAGTNFSNANRLSIGCKSPLTGGIKESNAGGTFAFAMGQLEIAGFTLNGQAEDWTVIRIPKDGPVTFEPAGDLVGKDAFDTAEILHQRYGDKVSLALIGSVAERQGLISGIAITDVEGRPTRIAARGGVGAVMGAKKIKAIVIDKHKMPPFHDRRKLMAGVKDYGARINESVPAQNMGLLGTAMVGDFTNKIGGLPTRNFSAGQASDGEDGPFKLGGDYIRELNLSRGGDTTHACMPGCMIKCSNVYHGEDGEELVSPVEYETLGLIGTNCGLEDPDDVARINAMLNDLAVDTIETGAMLGMLMGAGHAEFGDLEFMTQAVKDIGEGNERGLLLAQGTARVGEHYGIERVPVIKKQGISAYDPRVIEVTGISMMYTAQGADHTTGNNPAAECDGKSTEQLTQESLTMQMFSAAADSLGLCVFGRSVHNEDPDMIVDSINAAFDIGLEHGFLQELGYETIRLEKAFNAQAGFAEEDDELPEFFYAEELAPSGKKARHHAPEVNRIIRDALG